MKRLATIAALLVALVLTPTAGAMSETKVPVAPDGTKAVIDLPVDQHLMNTGGTDGLGLCVFSSITVSARWQNIPEMFGFRKWSEGRPGGATPGQIVSDLKLYEKETGNKVPPYVQVVQASPDFLRLALVTRRMPGITYSGFDDFYGYGKRIYHMVNLAHLDGKQGAIIDNNRPGHWEWMTDTEVTDRWAATGSGASPLPPIFPNRPRRPILPWRTGDSKITGSTDAWAFVWLAPPPPPGKEPVGPPAPRAKIVWEQKGEYLLAWEGNTFRGAVDSNGGWHAVTPDGAHWSNAVSPYPADITPPVAPPKPLIVPVPVPCPGPNCPRVMLGDKPITEAQADAMLLGDLTDDSNKYHLSFIGDRAEVSKWMLSGKVARFSDRLHVQVYDSKSWVVRDRLKNPVTLQEPAKAGGKVVGTVDSPTLDAVAAMLEKVFDPPAPPVTPVAPAPHDAPVVAPVDTTPGIPSPSKGYQLLLFMIAVFTASIWRVK